MPLNSTNNLVDSLIVPENQCHKIYPIDKKLKYSSRLNLKTFDQIKLKTKITINELIEIHQGPINDLW